MPPEDSRELLRRYARDGDEHAFRLLVERHAGLVYSAAQRKLGPLAAQAADVAQAVFIRLAQRAKVLPEGIVLAAWLHSMSVRYALNHLRAERRRAAREQIAHTMNVDHEPPAGWPPIASEIDDSLAALPTRDREALLLRYVEDLDLTGTGRALGISPDAAQKRIARALERLRAQLGRRGVVTRVATVGACLASPAIRAAPCGLATAVSKPALGAGRRATTRWLAMVVESWKAFPGPALAGTVVAALVSCAAAFMPLGKSRSLASEPQAAPAAVVKPREIVAPLTPVAEELMQLLRGQLSPEQIVAELERVTLAPRTATNRARMSALLELIGADNAATVADLADRTLPLAAYRTMKLILERWCRYDAAAAIEFVLEKNLDTKLEDQSAFGIAATLFRQWGKSDRTAAAAWLASNLSRRNLRNAGQLADSLLNELASTSPLEAAAFVRGLPLGRLRDQLMTSVCDERFATSWNAGQWSALASAVASHNESRGFYDLSAVIREWAAYDDAAARVWIGQLPPGPQKLAATVALVAVDNTWRDTSTGTGGWSHTSVPVTNRAERAAVVLVAAGSEPRGSVLAQIAAAWPEPDESAVDWVRTQAQGGAAADPALQVLAAKIAAESDKPSVQAKAIHTAGQITEPSLREDVMAGIFLRWHLTDAAAAEGWLAASGLPKDLVAPLTDAIAP